jgi:hypothetical protein
MNECFMWPDPFKPYVEGRSYYSVSISRIITKDIRSLAGNNLSGKMIGFRRTSLFFIINRTPTPRDNCEFYRYDASYFLQLNQKIRIDIADATTTPASKFPPAEISR